MRHLLTNIILAFAWAALMGEVSTVNLFIGFVLGYFILSFQERVGGGASYYKKGYQFLALVTHFIIDLFLSSFRVALDAITPRLDARPGIVAIPLEAKTDLEIMLLANMVSLTPGSLSLDLSEDLSTLYVHVMYIDDVDAVRRQIKEKNEKPLLELVR